ncbi:OpgC protein [Salmonella enterica subsp. enterica]|uniref:OpgC domain-containing protein n=1 Tax=Salmonella enterica TaxID=28901 RepID=UPI0009B1A719|nr:OpgC domain-containing protein [Salmonella enterica]EBY6678817.1 OpgC protein [Salmonella enterica subsp. enterica serovar Saphra]EDV1284477.1 OpgC protein [Salmonella enterica subsp. enterica]EEN5143608.1 OpgC protein [Salmonella enterica subsp. enterica serovar Oranienburg]EEP8162947.1 succinyl transferase OpgC [Salmonella enterica subsp. enterica serovar Poona]QVB78758.1 OpgC domain-containing protein [Salmonella enterica subsp. enterica serovar Rubislaw]
MSHIAPVITQKERDKTKDWRYCLAGARDLRIDFMRGIALVMMVVAHTEVMSIFNIFTWERFGLTTGAEGFVILSGFMLGMLNRVRLQKAVLLTISWGLYLRAWKIYQVNIIIIISFLLLGNLPFINVFEVTHFTDRYAGTTWSLYPVTPQIKETWFNIVLYLQIGPHQTQILGLYIFLLLLGPLFLGMLQQGKVYWLLGLSLLVYGCWQRWPVRVTPSEFEFAFPLLAWQFIFVLGMSCGWYKEELLSFARTPPGKVAVATLVVVALILGFVAQNHTNPFMPPALLLHIIPPAEFNAFYHTWAAKNGLGPIRVLNDISLMVAVYLLLTWCWQPLYRLAGWFLIPLGQRSLYTFILHVYVVLAVSQFATFDLWRQDWVVNTLIHAVALGVLWLMAKYNVAARWIPN